MKLRKILIYKDDLLYGKKFDSYYYAMLLARQDYIIKEHQVRFHKYLIELMRSIFEKDDLSNSGN